MARCEECIHSRVCVIRGFPSAFENTHWEKEPCDHFKAADVAPMAEWISVEERLPDAETPVLVFTKKGSFYVGYYYKAVTNPGFTGFYADYAKRDVTHWMPLPSPPEPTKGD